MTTAHRPTWKPAVGSNVSIGFNSQQISAKDQRGMTTIKYRQVGQSSQTEMSKRNILEELEQREYEQLSLKNKAILDIENEEKKVDSIGLLKNHEEKPVEVKKNYDDEDIDYDEDEDRESEFDSSADEGSDEDDDEDEELALQRELEKIKAERALAQAKKEEEDRLLEEAMNKESAMKGNPLLNLNNSGPSNEKVKRKWNDDVVFRNQTRTEPEQKKRFVNDTIRSDFHRSFLKKYIQ